MSKPTGGDESQWPIRKSAVRHTNTGTHVDVEPAIGSSTPELSWSVFRPVPGKAASVRRVRIVDLPFGLTDWSAVAAERHAGASGHAEWRTRRFGEVRVRMVRYSAGYLADHWCTKGHVLLCLDGELCTELRDGRRFTLTAGMSYQVADDAEPHRSYTETGAKLFVVD
jgi:hypothetical protein